MALPLQNKLAVGIDIGGTSTKIGIVDVNGDIKYRTDLSSTDNDSIEEFIEQLYQTIQPIINEHGGNEIIKGIGIGAPNGNFYKGTIDYAPNLKWKGVIPLAYLVNKRFNLPAILTNDANAAAVGEMIYGAAKGMKDFIMITLGTGVGSGIVANGQLIYGHDGFAGELGHTVIIPNGRFHPGTNMYGSLETYASATGVRRTAIELMENTNEESLLRSIPVEDIDSKAVYDCAVKGDAIAKEVFRFTGEVLGKALANFVMFSSPEAIILFGGVTKAGDLIINPTRQHMEANLLPIFQNKVKLIFSQLKEADAAILGASALVWGNDV